MIKRIALLIALSISSFAQLSTSTITGTIKDRTGAAVTSGKVTFTEIPGVATTDGGSVFVPNTATCGIDGSGLVKHQPDLAADCTVVYSTTQTPNGTWYRVDLYPQFGKTASFNLFVYQATHDISSAVITPATMPAWNVMDLTSNQVVTGTKVFKSLGGITNFGGFVYAAAYTGATLSAKVINACNSASGAAVTVVVDVPAGTGSYYLVPNYCNVIDLRGNGGYTQTAFTKGWSLYNRFTSVGAGLQIPSSLYIYSDFYRGGTSNIATTKTQWQSIRVEGRGRTVGERKGIESNQYCFGIGDCIGGMYSCYDGGGYSTGGDEGCEGGRFAALQGDGNTPVVPVGTVTGIAGDKITINWSANGSWVGEGRFLIVTSRATVTSGSIGSATFNVAGDQLCHLNGSGTTWTGIGYSGDVFFKIDTLSSSSPAAKFVIGPATVVSDTDARMTVGFNETGNGCLAAATSSTYTAYVGAVVTSLDDPVGTSDIATIINVGTGKGARFQVGDTVEVPLAYNNHPTAGEFIVGCYTCIGAHAVTVNNVFTQPFNDALFVNGNYTNGLRFGSGLITGAGVQMDSVTGPYIKSANTTGRVQQLFQLLDVGFTSRTMTFDTTNKWWTVGNAYFDATASQMSLNSTIQPNIAFYMGYPGTARNGLLIAPTAAGNAGVLQFGVYNNGGLPLVGSDQGNNRFELLQGIDFKVYSDNLATLKASIIGSTGVITGTSLASTVATGTPPLSVASTTNVPNLNASSLNGATFASPGAIGGTVAGTGAFTTVSASGQVTSTVSTGTPPLVVASTTNIPNLNASSLSGNTFANPGAIGGGTPSTVAATTVTATGQVTAKRLSCANGTAVAAGDFALAGAWGNTASIGSVVGTDCAFAFTITSAGTGQANPAAFTFTFHDGTFGNSPICQVLLNGGTGSTMGVFANTTESATAPVFTESFSLPVAATTYRVTGMCTGR